MDVEPALARGSLRFSLGHTSTAQDVHDLTEAIGPVVERARSAGLQGMRRSKNSSVKAEV
jgi:cysteine desulfurase